MDAAQPGLAGGARVQAAVSYRSICLISSLRSQRAGSALWQTQAVSLIIPQSNLVPYLLGRAQNLFPHSCAHAYSRGQEVRSTSKTGIVFQTRECKKEETDQLPPFSFTRCSLAGGLAPLKGLCHEMIFLKA
jgi:hypothetical protein